MPYNVKMFFKVDWLFLSFLDQSLKPQILMTIRWKPLVVDRLVGSEVAFYCCQFKPQHMARTFDPDACKDPENGPFPSLKLPLETRLGFSLKEHSLSEENLTSCWVVSVFVCAKFCLRPKSALTRYSVSFSYLGSFLSPPLPLCAFTS